MNVNQILNMILRIFMRRAINKGITVGARHMRRGKGHKKPGGTQGQAGVKTKQALRAARRGSRF